MSARNVLYLNAAFYTAGSLYYVQDFKSLLIESLVYLVLAVLFFGLGKWSNSKPVTALLISFVVMTTLVALNTWLDVSKLFINATSWYILAAQLVLLFFITRGVKAAYKADILDDVCN